MKTNTTGNANIEVNDIHGENPHITKDISWGQGFNALKITDLSILNYNNANAAPAFTNAASTFANVALTTSITGSPPPKLIISNGMSVVINGSVPNGTQIEVNPNATVIIDDTTFSAGDKTIVYTYFDSEDTLVIGDNLDLTGTIDE